MMEGYPEPDWRVLGIARGHRYPQWWAWDHEGKYFYGNTMDPPDPHEIETIIDHPRNDSEAIAVINQAKEERTHDRAEP